MLEVHTVQFSYTPKGQLRIAFDDAVFARAEMIFIDPSTRRLTGMIGPVHFEIGMVPTELGTKFMKHDYVVLTAPHPKGHDMTLTAALETLH